MHDRRARPTLRLIAGGLDPGWDEAWPPQSVAAGRLDELHPLRELPHPLILKAAGMFGGPSGDTYLEKIKQVERVALWEVRAGRWRGAVYQDPTYGVFWLCAAGLARGEHEDRDDFYEVLGRMSKEEIDALLPTEEDFNLLKRETAASLLTNWELDIQATMLATLREVGGKGEKRITFRDPLDRRDVATVTLTTNSFDEPGYVREECVVEIRLSGRYRTSDLGWRLTERVLVSVCPPVQAWDRTGDTFSTILDVGDLQRRASQLASDVDQGQLATLAFGDVSHYVHGKHLAASAVNGKALRALCGVIFVPMQDHARFEPCPECQRLRDTLPETVSQIDTPS